MSRKRKLKYTLVRRETTEPTVHRMYIARDGHRKSIREFHARVTKVHDAEEKPTVEGMYFAEHPRVHCLYVPILFRKGKWLVHDFITGTRYKISMYQTRRWFGLTEQGVQDINEFLKTV